MRIFIILLATILYAKVYKISTTTKWEPFNTEINGKLAGISVDYWKLIAKKAGIKYKFVIMSTWVDVLNSIKNSQADIALGAGKTKERESYAVFSKPYVTFPLVIATKNDVGFIPDVTFLQNKTIAVGRNYTADELLKKYYPNLKILRVSSIDKALKLVKEGKVFAAIDILPVIAYKINKYQFNNLKISGQLDIKFPVRFMVNKKEKDLIPILNKAIDKLTFEEREEIYKKWVKAKHENEKPLIYLIAALSFSVIVLIAWVVLLKVRLKREKEYEKMLKNISYIDYLTGASNKKRLIEFVKELNFNNKSYCLIFFDIKDFSKINDLYGTQIGDIILVEISSIAQGFLSKNSVFGRWDNDNFLIIIPECNYNSACKLANRLYNEFQNHNFGINQKIEFYFIVKNFKNTPLEKALEEIKYILMNAKKSEILICN